MNKETETAWSTSTEAVNFLGVSERTLRRYAASGRIKTLKIGRQQFYDLESYQEGVLEEAKEAGSTIDSPFVAVIYDSRKAPNIAGGRVINRPSITFMLNGGTTQLYDGSYGKVYRNLCICQGANLSVRLPSNGGMITGDDINEILAQGYAQKLLETGQLVVFTPASPEFGASYRSYSQNDSLSLISATYCMDSLQRYSQGEDRLIIKAAVEEKRQEIEHALNLIKTQIFRPGDSQLQYRSGSAT